MYCIMYKDWSKMFSSIFVILLGLKFKISLLFRGEIFSEFLKTRENVNFSLYKNEISRNFDKLKCSPTLYFWKAYRQADQCKHVPYKT